MNRLALVLLLAFVCSPLWAATTHKVPTDFATIAAAVAAAADGDTISISKNPATFDGSYNENVVVPAAKRLNFVGKVIWDGNIAGVSGTCLTIDGPSAGPILISGITFRNASVGVAAGLTGGANDVDNVTVTGCRGINTDSDWVRIIGDNAVVSKNTLIGTRNDPIDIEGPNALVTGNKLNNTDGTGIRITNGDGAIVSKNKFLNHEDGDIIDIVGDTAQIVSNSLKNGDGSMDIDGIDGLISGNKCQNMAGKFGITNGTGGQVLKNKIDLTDSNGINVDGDDIIISGNSITNSFNDAIRTDGANNEVLGNKISKCEGGINCSNADGSTIDKNKISIILDNDCITASGDDINITNNSINDATDDADGIDLSTGGSGGGLIDKNKVKNVAGDGVSCSSPGVTISNNSVSFAGCEEEEGFDISGDTCILTKNKAANCDGDGFTIGGAGCTVTDCTATNNSEDGFDCQNDNNTFTNCKASGNGGEGFDNSASIGTDVEGGSFTKNRIDFANDSGGGGTVNFNPAPTIGDGSGATTDPEVD